MDDLEPSTVSGFGSSTRAGCCVDSEVLPGAMAGD